MKTADDVLKTDLDYIVRQAGNELAKLSGRRVLVAGGAGFLGYYLVRRPPLEHPECRSRLSR